MYVHGVLGFINNIRHNLLSAIYREVVVMSERENKPIETDNWFVGFIIFVSFVLLYCLLFFGFIAFLNWNDKATSFFATCLLTLAFLLLPFASIKLFGSEKVDKYIEAKIGRLTDLDGFIGKKIIDIIFAHFGNVSVLGLALSLIVFGLRDYIESFQKSVAISLTSAFVTVLILYSILFAKLLKFYVDLFLNNSSKSKVGYFIVLLFIFFVDSSIFTFMLKSIPG